MPNFKFVRQSVLPGELDRRTDRHTNDVKTITPSADMGCNKFSLVTLMFIPFNDSALRMKSSILPKIHAKNATVPGIELIYLLLGKYRINVMQ